MEAYLLKCKHDALSSFPVLVRSVPTPSGSRVEFRVDKGGEFIGKEFQGSCFQTGFSLEYASTNTPQQIGMSERVEELLLLWCVACLPTADR